MQTTHGLCVIARQWLASSNAYPSTRGRRIRYEEVPFQPGATAHSRFVDGVVQANTLHPDFLYAARSLDSRLADAALMIGKESIAYNDRSGAADDFLETLLDFSFKLQARSRPRRGRAQPATDTEQTPLDLNRTSHERPS